MEAAIIIFGIISFLLTLNYHFLIKPMEKYKQDREVKKHKLLGIINSQLNQITLFSQYKQLVSNMSNVLCSEYMKDSDYDNEEHIRIVLAHFFLSSMGKQPKNDKEYNLREEIVSAIVKSTSANVAQHRKHIKILKSFTENPAVIKKWDEYLHALAKYIYSKKKKGSKIPNIKLNEYFEIMEVLSQRQFEFYAMLYDEDDFYIDDIDTDIFGNKSRGR